jgi:hypothetical protein
VPPAGGLPRDPPDARAGRAVLRRRADVKTAIDLLLDSRAPAADARDARRGPRTFLLGVVPVLARGARAAFLHEYSLVVPARTPTAVEAWMGVRRRAPVHGHLGSARDGRSRAAATALIDPTVEPDGGEPWPGRALGPSRPVGMAVVATEREPGHDAPPLFCSDRGPDPERRPGYPPDHAPAATAPERRCHLAKRGGVARWARRRRRG